MCLNVVKMFQVIFLIIGFSIFCAAQLKNETLPITTTSATTTTSTSTSTTEKAVSLSSTNSSTPSEEAMPIMLTVIPDISQYGGETTKHFDLTCSVSGQNLQKIGPYKLCWYLQVDAGETLKVKCEINGTDVKFDNDLAVKYYYKGSGLFCGLIFNELSPKYYSVMHSKYISLLPPTFHDTGLSSSTSKSVAITSATPLIPTPSQSAMSTALTVVPDINEYGGETTKNVNLTCLVSGQNLLENASYELCWYLQGDTDKNMKVKCEVNGTDVVFDNNLAVKYYSKGSQLFCTLIFSKLSPKYDSVMRSKYISLLPPTFDHTRTRLIIAISAGSICILMLCVAAGLIYRRCSKFDGNSDPPPIPQEPSQPAQETEYSYVPLPRVSLYEAKAMVAANKKNTTKSVKPPPLPERPVHLRSIRDEEENAYTYAYGVKKN